jgi:hypothetical protein
MGSPQFRRVIQQFVESIVMGYIFGSELIPVGGANDISQILAFIFQDMGLISGDQFDQAGPHGYIFAGASGQDNPGQKQGKK